MENGGEMTFYAEWINEKFNPAGSRYHIKNRVDGSRKFDVLLLQSNYSVGLRVSHSCSRVAAVLLYLAFLSLVPVATHLSLGGLKEMNRKFLALVLLVLFVLLAIAPLGFGKKPEGCASCDWTGNCGACSHQAFNACVNDPGDRIACWDSYYAANCAAKFGCNGDINPF